MSPSGDAPLLPPHGNYRQLLSYVRRLGRNSLQSYETYSSLVGTRPGGIVANIALCLIRQADDLLDQQIRRLECDFLKEGGLRERMTRPRLQSRVQSGRPFA